MCGICGFTGNDRELAQKMARAIAHRGPDQEGIFCADGISLAFRRLSIIDLSENARQPMVNEDGSVRLVFNGEIYNFMELRERLIAKGHRFASKTDSEVILHGYEEYGTDVLKELRGMFAFAIWDGARKRLFLARDRIGIKPLYYHSSGGRLVFASEIKAILEDPSVPRRLNRRALYDYLGFEFVPAPDTMFRDIFKLPAGHFLVHENGRTTVSGYWDLVFPDNGPGISFEDAIRREMELLDEAVKSHLISDVPLGVFLSGGLDSSTLVALMRRHISGRLRTFTIGYEDKSFSELDYAKQVADVFATDHQVLMIDSFKPEYVEQTLWHMDEPMTDLSSIPLYLVCREARKHITVCLSGEGGDEIFAGYDRFKASRLGRLYGMIPGPVRRSLIEPWAAGISDRPQKKGPANMLKRFVEGAALPTDGRHLRWQYFSNEERDRHLFTEEFRQAAGGDPFRTVRGYDSRCTAGNDIVNREIYLDTRFMMADSVLMKVDKMSMASSLEIRVPFLDHVVVEYNASLPGKWKLKGFTTKHILRQALKGVLPERIVNRGKQGYSLPVKHLLRNELREYMTELLNTSSLVRDNMDMQYVNTLIKEHQEMRHNHNHVLWGLINTAIWQRRFNVTG